MRFDRLLWQCLLPGQYEFSEEDIGVRLSPVAGETVLMFQTDTNAFREGQSGVVGQSSPLDVKARMKQAWEERGLSFRYHFGARGKTVDLRPHLADTRRVKPAPAATPTAPLALPGGTQ